MPFFPRLLSFRSFGGKDPWRSTFNYPVKKTCQTKLGDAAAATAIRSSIKSLTTGYGVNSEQNEQSKRNTPNESNFLWTPIKSTNQSQASFAPAIETTSSNFSPALTPLPIITAPAPEQFATQETDAIVNTAKHVTVEPAILAISATATASDDATTLTSAAPVSEIIPVASSFIPAPTTASVDTSAALALAPVSAVEPSPLTPSVPLTQGLAHNDGHDVHGEEEKESKTSEVSWAEKYYYQALTRQQVVQALFLPFSQPLDELAPKLKERLDIAYVLHHQKQLFAQGYLPVQDSERQKRAEQWAWLAQLGFFTKNKLNVSDTRLSLKVNTVTPNKNNKSVEIKWSLPCTDNRAFPIQGMPFPHNGTYFIPQEENINANPIANNCSNCFVAPNAVPYITTNFSAQSLKHGLLSNKETRQEAKNLSFLDHDYLSRFAKPESIEVNNRRYTLIKSPQNISDLKNNFVFLRHRLKLRQHDLSAALNCQQSYIAQWESRFNPDSWFPDQLLPVIAKLLHCSPVFLDRSAFDYVNCGKYKVLRARRPNNTQLDLCRKPVSSTQIYNNLNFILCYRKYSWTQLYQYTGFNHEMMEFWHHSKLLQMDSAICWKLASFLQCPMQLLTFNFKRHLPHFIWE